MNFQHQHFLKIMKAVFLKISCNSQNTNKTVNYEKIL